MKSSFSQLFLANIKILYRNKSGFFWTVAMPGFIYIAVSMLPVGRFVNTNEARYSDFLLPGIIAMGIMQGGIYGLAYWMIDMKSQGVIKRLLVTPINTRQLIMSLIASRLVQMVLQVILLTLIGVVFFHAKFAGNILSILFLILLGGPIFLLIGLLIANYAKSYETAAPVTSAIGMPLLFLTNIFYSISVLPHPLQIIAKLLPITYLADGFRQAYLYPFNLQVIGKDMAIIALWLALLLAIVVRVFKLKEE